MDHETPFFIVGVPRSGTTLLRQMLRGHPRLAIPRESHFVPAALAAPDGATALDVVVASKQFATWGIDAEDVRRGAGVTDMTPASVVRATFEAYAKSEGKVRWGDKTPTYLEHMTAIGGAFDGAQFVHIIRDGRDVATSMREAWWGPDELVFAARMWRRLVTDGRRVGAAMPADRYLEVRYETFVADPESELARVLGFLGEDMVAGLLDYQERAAAEQPRTPAEHRHLLEAPKPGMRDWRASCTPAEQSRLEALLAPTLRRLGYEVDPPSRSARAGAELYLLARRGQAALTRRP